VNLTLDLYCSEGSPMKLTPPDIHARGVGGAELAMMTWAETMAGRGHKVRIFNDPAQPGDYGGVEYRPCNDFDWRQSRDVFIVFRSPNRFTRLARAAVKLFWSCDQYTSGNFATDIIPHVDRTVCISPFHVSYFMEKYRANPETTGYFDLGVRVEEYRQDIPKAPGRCIFCSVPDRGLAVLRMMWPKIKERVPGASLVITSDYTLWGAANPLNHEHRLNWLGLPDVEFVGKISRERLVQEQLKAVCQPYPSSYNELFCISAAECQVANCAPITSGLGALPTTNQWGEVLPGNILDGAWQEAFINRVCSRLDTGPAGSDEAARRFDWQTICGQWEHLIETGEFAPQGDFVTGTHPVKGRSRRERVPA